MSRLTDKEYAMAFSGGYFIEDDKEIPEIGFKEIYAKLSGYEDIEEEAGIPLEVIAKAVKDGVWYKDDSAGIVKHSPLVDEAYEVLAKDGELVLCGWGTLMRSLPYREYGKTWSLTKEELEK